MPRPGSRLARAEVILAGLACLILLTGCVPPVLGGTQPIIKIGLAAPFEGVYRPLGYEAIQGVKLALAEQNAAGGVGGYMVELVALDHSGSPKEARQQALEFGADPDVVGVVTGSSQATAAAALPVYQEQGIPVVLAWSVSPELADPDAGVVMAVSDSHQAAAQLAEFASPTANTKIAVVGEAQSTAPYVTALSSLSVEARSVTLPQSPNTNLFQEWAQALVLGRPQPPDTVILACDGIRAGQAAGALRQAGWQGALLAGPEAGSVQLIDVGQSAANEIIFVSPAPTGAGLPETSADLSPRGVAAYDATRLLLAAILDAVEHQGIPSRQAVGSQLPITKAQGLAGQLELDSNGLRRDARVWFYRVEGEGYPGRLLPESAWD